MLAGTTLQHFGFEGSLQYETCNSVPMQVAVVEPGMRRLGRKMLGELELSGDGTSVQTTDLGVSGTASGHGVINGLDDAHIQVRLTEDMPPMYQILLTRMQQTPLPGQHILRCE